MSDKSNVLVADSIHGVGLAILQENPALDVIAPGKMARPEKLSAVAKAHGLIVRSGTQVDAELLEAAGDLRVVVRAGVGVDNIDVAAADAHGVVVMNTPGGSTIAVAEHTLALMLALMRHIPHAHASLGAGKWARKAFMGSELSGKTLGLVGLGRIGAAVAERARAFGMAILAFDPYLTPNQAAERGAKLVDFDTLLAQSDILSLHCALTDSTRGMIGADALANAKPGIRIVNAARGALIDSGALRAALEEGRAAGAALDVYDVEPPGADHSLIGHPRVVHTPHLAASTSEAQEAVALEAARKMIGALLNDEYTNVIRP
jgi:D-3-phosphoglycerate dehydrogenase